MGWVGVIDGRSSGEPGTTDMLDIFGTVSLDSLEVHLDESNARSSRSGVSLERMLLSSQRITKIGEIFTSLVLMFH